MTGDLLIITPTRGRPDNLKRLLETVHATARAATHVIAGVDDDDPELLAYHAVMDAHGGEGDLLRVAPRMGLVAWTNAIAADYVDSYSYLASLGDDHVPRTKGWDAALIRAIEDMGGTGFAYPWDGVREDIPEAVVMSSGIVAALGWMCLPELSHWYPDNVWADLGRGAGCLRHCRAVWVEHAHPVTGKAPGDKTYQESAVKIAEDKAAYQQWRAERMAADIAVVRELRERVPAPA